MMRESSRSRGRLTPPDIILAGVAALLVTHFAPAMLGLLDSNADSMSPGTVFLFELMVPALLMTILAWVYYTGATGGGA